MSKNSKSGSAWNAQRQRVLRRDNWTCSYCGSPIEGDNATVDHVSPVVLDPDHVYQDDELIAACRTCNGRKGARPYIRQNYYSPRWS